MELSDWFYSTTNSATREK